MSSEQRGSARVSLHADFRAREHHGVGALLFESADLSVGGAFLRADLLLEVGDALALEFRVPAMPRLLKAQARVAWVRRFPKDGEEAGMGVQFLAMSEEDRAALGRYLGAGPA